MCGCGKELDFTKGRKNKKYIHGHNSRVNHPLKCHTEESNKKNRLSHLGKHYSTQTEFKKGEHHSQKTEFKKGRVSPRGKDHPCYGKKQSLQQIEERRKANTKKPEDRISLLNKQIRSSEKYDEWRVMIFGRDNFTCQKCGIVGTYLHAHHKKYLSLIVKENNIATLEQALDCNELWNLDNGITLCSKCHNKLPKKKGVEYY